MSEKESSMYEKAKQVVTVDLDSTLCDTGHRHRLIDRANGTDWGAYSLACSDDSLIEGTAVLIRIVAASHEIHYVSGRAEIAREATLAWLKKHDLPVDGLWMDDSSDSDHVRVYGSHSAYKVARVKHVEDATRKKVVLHIDDWAEVKVALEKNGIPCLCVRTPQEVVALVSGGTNLVLG